MRDVEITSYRPGAIGRVVALHATYYAAEWGFDIRFEAKVAEELGALISGFDPGRDGFWIAWADGALAGSLSIHGRDGDANEARLRFFIVDPAFQGRGIGERLMRKAMAFCDRAGFARVYLTTFAGLDAARRLYERHGFRLTGEQDDTTWGPLMREQTFVRERGA